MALGVATVAGVLSFLGKSPRLFPRSALYGWNRDVQIGDAFPPDLLGQAQHLTTDPAMAAVEWDHLTAPDQHLSVDTLASGTS